MNDVLLERRAMATAQATMLVAQSSELSAAIARNRRALAELRSNSAALRRALATAGATRASVVVTGSIGERDVSAAWHRSGRMAADDELLDRARVLVALGETWHPAALGLSRSSSPIEASLDGPSIAVALTLMRACTRIYSVTLPGDP
jgi:hypothetical protein